MRLLSFLTTILIAGLLFACGGGGGSPGLSSGPNSALSVAAPAAVTLQVGSTQQYTVKGGVPPYSVFSNDPAVAVGWLIGDNVVAVGTVAAGKATVTLADSQGAKFNIAVTAGSNTLFFTSAPSALTLSPGVPQIYTLGGGTGPYTVTSSFPSLVTVKLDGSNMTVTGMRIDTTNSATITMRDAAGATLTSAVSVKTTEFKLTPGQSDSATVYLGDTLNMIITGGTPPYRVVESIAGVFEAKIVNGNQVQMIGNRVAEGVQLNVVDADNQSAAGPKVKIVAGQDVLRISPAALSFPENANTPNIVLNVYGVTPGSPITVFTTNSTLLIPGTPVKANATGSAYTITLSAGNTCSTTAYVPAVPAVVGPPAVAAIPEVLADRTVTITVLDSTGSKGTSTITAVDTDKLIGCTL